MVGVVDRRPRPAARNSIVHNIVSLAIDRLGKWTIGDVFPGLPSQVELANLDLPVRARNVLYREQILTGADIAELKVESLLALRNAGVGTVTAILRELVEVSSFQAQATFLEAASAGDVEAVDEPSPWLGGVLQDFEALADWHHILGNIDRGLLSELPLGAPESVVAARKRLLELSAGDFFRPVPRTWLINWTAPSTGWTSDTRQSSPSACSRGTRRRLRRWATNSASLASACGSSKSRLEPNSTTSSPVTMPSRSRQPHSDTDSRRSSARRDAR